MLKYCKVLKTFCKLFKQSYVSRSYSNRNVVKLYERGMLEDIFPPNKDEIVDLLNGKVQCVYAGFDPTAKSLHLGNLLVLINLLHWQRGGHQVIALVGGATGRIGDPSGRNKDREEQETHTVISNAFSIEQMIQRIFKNHEDIYWKDKSKEHPLTPIRICNNEDWYKKLNSVDFVCGVGRHFRVGTMLNRTSVASRLNSETGISFTEFTYMIFQAYDWLQLLKKYDCRFQVGGNDQMGNIVAGYDLITRLTDKKVYGMTLPLVTTESGNKYGKSAGNAIWLDPEMTSPFELYQFFIRTKDADVEKLLKLFTFDTVNSIEDLCRRHKEHPEKRLAQKKLADDVTRLVHGEAGLVAAQKATDAMYDTSIEKLSQLSVCDISGIFKGATVVNLLLKPGITILEFALSAACFRNESDARRIIQAGGFYINHQRVTNVDEVLSPSVHVLPNKVSVVRVGKKNYWIVKWSG